MSSQTILREYLLSLGFKVDTTGQKKFDGVLSSTGKTAGAAGLAVGALGGTILALAQQYASAMEKMYYASRRSGSTVTQMQAMEYAGEKVGLAAGTMTAAVTGMASKLRMNRGLIGLLTQIGVQTQGRTPAQELMDLIDKTATMDYQKGASIASLFGLDEGTYQVMRQNRKEMRTAMEEREAMSKKMGSDDDKNAEAMAQWGKQVTELKAVFQTFKGVIATSMLEPMKEVAAVGKTVLEDWTKILQHRDMKKIGSDVALGLGFNTLDKVTPAGGGLGNMLDDVRRKIVDMGMGAGSADRRLGKKGHTAAELAALDKDFKTGGTGGTAVPATAGVGGNRKAFLGRLEEQWGLPKGLLYAVEGIESAHGKNMESPAGAKGWFGFMPKTAEAYGIAGKENDPNASAGAAAHMWHDMFKQYGGDMGKAVAGYNWGSGNFAGVGNRLENAPEETQKYAARLQREIQQTNNITITSGDAGIAGAVRQGLAQANGDLVRNLKTVVN